MKITTIKGGQEYRVVTQRYSTLSVILDGEYVQIYSCDTNQGLWKLERFGGQLNPAGIRKFMADMGIQ